METEAYGYDDARSAADYVIGKLEERGMDPDRVNDAVILGSGLGSFDKNHLGVVDGKDTESSPLVIPYNEVFRKLGRPLLEGGVKGHAKRLVVGQLRGGTDYVIAQSGREHLYEGVDPKRATFWIRVMQLLEAQTLIGSNASGIVTPHTLKPNDVITVMEDEDNTGVSPLEGINDDRFGTRFPHRVDYYPAHVRKLLQRLAAEDDGWVLKDGVYHRVSGPAYETSGMVYKMRRGLKDMYAEGRNQLGDEERWMRKPVGTVGMSSTYERLVARHAELSETYPAFKQGVGYLSVATNYSASLGPDGFVLPSSHEEVTENAGSVQDRVGNLVARAILKFEKQRVA